MCFEIIGFATIFNQYMACHPWDQRDKFFFLFFVCVKLNAAPISPTLSQFGPGQKPKWSWKAKFWAFGRSLKVKTLIDSLHDGQKISMYKYIICKMLWRNTFSNEKTRPIFTWLSFTFFCHPLTGSYGYKQGYQKHSVFTPYRKHNINFYK